LIVTDGPPVKLTDFDDVGIERPLREELGAADLMRLFVEDVDEAGADDLALDLGVGDTLQLADAKSSDSRPRWTSGMFQCCRGRASPPSSRLGLCAGARYRRRCR